MPRVILVAIVVIEITDTGLEGDATEGNSENDEKQDRNEARQRPPHVARASTDGTPRGHNEMAVDGKDSGAGGPDIGASRPSHSNDRSARQVEPVGENTDRQPIERKRRSHTARLDKHGHEVDA